ncbi:hypothetical protein KCU67_g10452, partial [Aureobasidium melanogenum]
MRAYKRPVLTLGLVKTAVVATINENCLIFHIWRTSPTLPRNSFAVVLKNHLVDLEYSDIQESSILFSTAFQYEPLDLSHTHLNAKGWCEEQIDNNPYEKRPDCLEKLLAFVKDRIDYSLHNKRVGLRVQTIYLHVDMVKHMANVMDGAIKELPGRLQPRLWGIHENFGVPSENIYINIDYWDPGW